MFRPKNDTTAKNDDDDDDGDGDDGGEVEKVESQLSEMKVTSTEPTAPTPPRAQPSESTGEVKKKTLEPIVLVLYVTEHKGQTTPQIRQTLHSKGYGFNKRDLNQMLEKYCVYHVCGGYKYWYPSTGVKLPSYVIKERPSTQ